MLPGPRIAAVEDEGNHVDLKGVIDETKSSSKPGQSPTTTDPDNFRYGSVTAGNGVWLLTAGDDGGLNLIPAKLATTGKQGEQIGTQSAFAYIKDAVSADDKQRLLAFSRTNMEDQTLEVSKLKLVDQGMIAEGDAAISLIPVEMKGGDTTLLPVDTLGDTYFPVACQVRNKADPSVKLNRVFVVKDGKKGVTTLGLSSAKIVTGGEFMEKCQQIAFDPPSAVGS